MFYTYFFVYSSRLVSTENHKYHPTSPLVDSNTCSFVINAWTNGTLIDLKKATLSIRMKLLTEANAPLVCASNNCAPINPILQGLIKSMRVFLNDAIVKRTRG